MYDFITRTAVYILDFGPQFTNVILKLCYNKGLQIEANKYFITKTFKNKTSPDFDIKIYSLYVFNIVDLII